MSSKIATDPERKIIAEFAKEIREKAEAEQALNLQLLIFAMTDKEVSQANEKFILFQPTFYD